MPTAPLFEFAKVIFEFGNPSLIEALRFSKSTRRVELICAQRIKASLIALTLESPPALISNASIASPAPPRVARQPICYSH